MTLFLLASFHQSPSTNEVVAHPIGKKKTLITHALGTARCRGNLIRGMDRLYPRALSSQNYYIEVLYRCSFVCDVGKIGVLWRKDKPRARISRI